MSLNQKILPQLNKMCLGELNDRTDRGTLLCKDDIICKENLAKLRLFKINTFYFKAVIDHLKFIAINNKLVIWLLKVCL